MCERGLAASVFQLARGLDGPEPSVHDALVLGSAVYEGRWLPEAREFLQAHRSFVSRHPVWLFSSGPVVGPLETSVQAAAGQVVDLAQLMSDTGAREHRLFGGRLRQARLDPDELSLVRGFGLQDTDLRDFAAINVWAESIANALTAGSPSGDADSHHGPVRRWRPDPAGKFGRSG